VTSQRTRVYKSLSNLLHKRNGAVMPMNETDYLLRGFALAAMERTSPAFPEDTERSYIFYDVAAQDDTNPYERAYHPPPPPLPRSPEQFVVRLKVYMRCSDSVYPFAIAVLERLARSEDGLECNTANFSRLITAVVVRCILLLDEPKLDMSYYARVINTSASTLNKLLSALQKILGRPGGLPRTEERNAAVAKYSCA